MKFNVGDKVEWYQLDIPGRLFMSHLMNIDKIEYTEEYIQEELFNSMHKGSFEITDVKPFKIELLGYHDDDLYHIKYWFSKCTIKKILSIFQDKDTYYEYIMKCVYRVRKERKG